MSTSQGPLSWAVLLVTETTTLHHLVVDDADLTYAADDHCDGLERALEARARELHAAGKTELVGSLTEPVEFASWEKAGSVVASRTLAFYEKTFTDNADPAV